MTKKTDKTEATEQTQEIQFDRMSQDELREHFGNWSKAIRGLSAVGYERKQIAAMLGRRYQHVRNVLITPLTSKQS